MVLPDHTPLESWGDARPRAGVRSLVQPTLRPLYDTRAFGDTLLDLGRALSPEAAAALPAGSFRGELEAAWAGVDFRAALEARRRLRDAGARGRRLRRRRSSRSRRRSSPATASSRCSRLPASASSATAAARALPWLQEIPDPVTHVAWDELGRAQPRRPPSALGVELGDVARARDLGRRDRGPALPARRHPRRRGRGADRAGPHGRPLRLEGGAGHARTSRAA